MQQVVSGTPTDVALEIQGRLAQARNYNQWLARTVAPYLGPRIADVGCAIGNITQYLLEGRERVVGVDHDPELVRRASIAFQDRPQFRGVCCDATASGFLELKEERLDSIVSLNVLEHIEDHETALRNMVEVLVPGGRVVLLVPALQWLYGSMDATDHHFRRYDKRQIRALFPKAGLRLERLFYMNLLGIAGWFLNGRIIKKTFVPEGQYGFFDRLVPLLSRVESLVPLPLGLSLVAVGRK